MSISSEFDVISKYFGDIGVSRSDVILGIGDDCAILKGNSTHDIAMTTDTLVEGVHFFPDAEPFSLGHKSLAVSLSDLAAMGAEPSWFSLAITLPDASKSWLKRFSAGLSETAKRFNIRLVGGDTTRGSLTITIQAFGWIEKQQALLRSNAQVSDCICVSGRLGDAALAVALKHSHQFDAKCHFELLHCLERPEPRVTLGRKLRGFAHAAIDISDGLLADLGHICKASSVGAIIQRDKIPISSYLKEYSKQHKWQYILAGGDDYELCFTLPVKNLFQLKKKMQASDVLITQIGHIVDGDDIQLMDGLEAVLLPHKKGFNHFD